MVYTIFKKIKFIVISLFLFITSLLNHNVLAEEESAGKLEEIIVTTERREINYQDLGGTAISFSGDDLKLQGILNLADLAESVVGLEIGNNQGNVEVWIRGVGSSNNTELGDPAAATHYDGIYVPRPSGIGSAFFDIRTVDGAVNGVANFVRFFSQVFKFLQSGMVQNYLLAMLLGVFLMLSAYLLQ